MRLKDWVDRQGKPVHEIAEALGIRRVALHRAMSGETMPRRQTCQNIETVTAGAVTVGDLAEANREYHATHAETATA